jgi:hypothetical protein
LATLDDFLAQCLSQTPQLPAIRSVEYESRRVSKIAYNNQQLDRVTVSKAESILMRGAVPGAMNA